MQLTAPTRLRNEGDAKVDAPTNSRRSIDAAAKERRLIVAGSGISLERVHRVSFKGGNQCNGGYFKNFFFFF